MTLNGDWSECRTHVLHELQRLDEASKENHKLLVALRTDMAVMQTSIAILRLKYAIYGALLGSVPVLIVTLIVRFLT